MADPAFQPKRRVPYPPEGKGSAKNLVPLRCPQPDHDRQSGFPMKFGISEQKDKDLEKKLLLNMRLADIEKLAEEASNVPIRKSTENQRANVSKASEKLHKAKSVADGDDMSLITSMAGRLRAAEQQIAGLKEEVKKKDGIISELRSSHSAVVGEVMEERVPSSVGKGTEADAAMLKEHNHKLRELLRRADQDNKNLESENKELKKFLRDYGMEWVGPEERKKKDELRPSKDPLKQGMWNPGVAAGEPEVITAELNDESGPDALGTPFDPARIMQCIKQLNILANEGEKEIEVGQDGIRRLKNKMLVRYIFYRNGIFARGGPLRPYKLEESKVLVRDLMDGYFPWELKEEYPEGVPLRVEMRLDEVYRPGVGGAAGGGFKVGPGDGGGGGGFRAFGGPGMALGQQGGEAGVEVVGPGQVGSEEVWRPAAGKSIGDTLFRRLPSHVVKNGNVISIKQDIMDKVRGKEEEAGAAGGRGGVEVVEVVEVPLEDERARAAGGREGDKEGEEGEKRTKIRVKTPDGGKVLEMEMRYSATVGQLKALAYKNWGGTGGIRLMSAMPRKELTEEGMTLEEAGLVPNAMLMMARE